MGEWVGGLRPGLAVPIRSGKSETAGKVGEYNGDIGGVLVFEANGVD